MNKKKFPLAFWIFVGLCVGIVAGIILMIVPNGVDFAERMAEIHRELLSLQAESNDLMDTISQNMKEMGL